MIFLQQRSEEAEWMDDLDCAGPVVEQTLRELDIINRWLGGNQVSTEGLEELLRGVPKDAPLRIADLGCGSGEMLIRIAKWGRKTGRKLELIGIDANPNIVRFAQNHCCDYPEIAFWAVDIFSEAFAQQPFDVVHASLFTHHFTSDQLIGFFRSSGPQVRLGWVVNDLHRHWFAYHSIKWLTRLFSRSPMVQNDAAVSVTRGFLRHEWEHILQTTPLPRYTLAWRWAFRWKLVVKK